MTFKEVVSHVTYCALFSQFSCHCHVISAHSRLSAYQKRRCAVVLSLEVLVLGPLDWLVLRWHIMMAPCGQTIHILAKNQREREREQEEKAPWSHPLQGFWCPVGPPWASVSRNTYTHACRHTRTHKDFFFKFSVVCVTQEVKSTLSPSIVAMPNS